jgi:transposase
MLMASGVVGGVDTHADVHVSAAVDSNRGVLGIESFPVNAAEYRRLGTWLTSSGAVVRVGVEGTGSYGVGLARHLHRGGIEVVEVDRANRQTLRRLGSLIRSTLSLRPRRLLRISVGAAEAAEDGSNRCGAVGGSPVGMRSTYSSPETSPLPGIHGSR